MVGSELPKHLLAHFHVVVRHVEHMACGMRQEDSGGRSRGLRTGDARGDGDARKPGDGFQAGPWHLSTVFFVDVLQTNLCLVGHKLVSPLSFIGL